MFNIYLIYLILKLNCILMMFSIESSKNFAYGLLGKEYKL